VGLLDESDLLLAVTRDPDAPIEALMPIFDAGLVALVVDQRRFLGLITRMDLLQFLRRAVH
jgi:cystathionine beta-synthase